jgi:uncharacterized protein (DUF58 family)
MSTAGATAPRGMLARLRHRLNAWIATRTPRVTGPWRIDRRRVYIVPTRYGYGFAVLLLVMLLGAMNYSNSMAFALTFLLAGIGLLAMHDTHGNLVNLTVAAGVAEPVHVGEPARYALRIDNPSRSGRYAIAAAWQDATVEGRVDVAAGDSGSTVLSLPTTRRGWLPAPRFSVETEFPLGLFHAWTWVELDLACLVYPAPAAPGLAPPAGGGGDGGRHGARPGPEEFAGLRSYQPGDPLRAIDWKSLARQPPAAAAPQVKQFVDPEADPLWLDWQALPVNWDLERRLSQLTRWVLDADAAGRAVGLRLPGVALEPALGDRHRHACLRALALHP